MSKFGNTKKDAYLSFLDGLPSLFDKSNNLTTRCKFNFSYFDSSQAAGQAFSKWTFKQLCELLDKLGDYSAKTLNQWSRERAGGSGLTVLAIYGGFPPKSHFTQPKHVPYQAQWGRFRLGSKIRLVGFTVPGDLHRQSHPVTNELFDKNTFYVVFLDKDHKFYITEKK